MERQRSSNDKKIFSDAFPTNTPSIKDLWALPLGAHVQELAGGYLKINLFYGVQGAFPPAPHRTAIF